MKTGNIQVLYTENKENKGATYFYDNRYMNRGELIETAIARDVFGLKWHRKDCLAFDEAPDFMADNIAYSVKSYESSLCDKVTTNSKDEAGKQYIIDEYIKKSKAQAYVYGVLKNDIITYYIMSADEFFNFLRLWKLDDPSGIGVYKLRAKRNQKEFRNWFAERGVELA